MLILLDYGWPWLVVGFGLMTWGTHIIGISWRDWLSILISLPFIYFSDDTEAEKQEAKATLEEVTEANPGCVIIGLGLMAIIVGVVKIVF